MTPDIHDIITAALEEWEDSDGELSDILYDQNQSNWEQGAEALDWLRQTVTRFAFDVFGSKTGDAFEWLDEVVERDAAELVDVCNFTSKSEVIAYITEELKRP